MKFSIKTAVLANIPTSCLVLGIHDKSTLSDSAREADKSSKGAIGKILRQGDMNGKIGQSLLLHAVPGLKAKRVLLVGCGAKSNLDAKKLTSIARHTLRTLEKYSLADALLTLVSLESRDSDITSRAKLIAQTIITGQYRYSQTKSKSAPAPKLKKLDLHVPDRKQQTQARKGLALGTAVGKGMNIARELGNLPGNICTPTYLADKALALAKTSKKLKTRVLSEAQMKRLGMGSLLSVSAGSVEPAKLIIMEYKGATSGRPNIIVGKGITFDTGGISLKAGAGMDEMKFDMCGAASVMGAMTSLCELNAKVNVIGIIASAENMPSGNATKPGDIVTSMSGQTIEVLNTDAEGRLVLCDALTYAERYNPKSVIDIATLTGACIVALGSHVSGLMSNNDELADKLYQSGLKVLDPVWRLPIWDEYQKQLDSNFADIANIGGPKAGTITAACFLSRFTQSYPWAHLDIAGTAWLQGEQKGATGRPVPLLVEYLLNA